MERWTVGDVAVTKIEEMSLYAPPSQMFPGLPDEALAGIGWLKGRHGMNEGALEVSIHALLVEAPGVRIVVDTCVGDGKPRQPMANCSGLESGFLGRLAAAGCAPEEVGVVLCTHLHFDHVGWNTRLADGAWVPTFPNARYLFARAEYDYWRAEAERPEESLPFDALHTAGMADSVEPIFAAGLAELVEADHRICPEVSLIPTPGHTPGHVSVLIRSRGQEALITGDACHHPCQLAHPEWRFAADRDGPAAADSRRGLFRRAEEACALAIGTHWPTPTAGRVVKDGEAWRLETE